jgi:hypothetical protein
LPKNGAYQKHLRNDALTKILSRQVFRDEIKDVSIRGCAASRARYWHGTIYRTVLEYRTAHNPSDIQVNVNPITNIYIRSNSLVQRDSYESIIEKDVFSDILAKVPVSVAPGSFIFYSSGSFIELENKIIDQIALYLSDNLSYSLSLNGLTWNTHLIFEEFGTTESDNLLNYSDQPPPAPQIDNTEVLNQIEDLKKQIDDSKKDNLN